MTPRLSSWTSHAPDLDGGEERSRIFSAAGGDASPALEAEEGIFHEMAQFVEIPVVFALDFAVFLGWYHGLHALFCGLLKDRVGVIASVGQQMFGGDPFHQL